MIPPGDVEDLPLHKQRLISVARSVDPLAPLKHHPGLTVGYAAALGVVAASPAAAEAMQTAVTSSFKKRLASIVGGQLAQMLNQYVGQRMAPPAK